MTTVLLDCDGVVFDLATPVYKFARKLLGRKLPRPETWDTYEFAAAMKLTRNEREYLERQFTRTNNIGWKVGLYPGAASFIEHLGANHQVVFVTAPWQGLEHWVEARMSLLNIYLSRSKFRVVLTEHKELVKGDWLVDDHFKNIAANRERGILFQRPWNVAQVNSVDFSAADYTEAVGIIEK